ncbi:MAG: preprotein translocase subunit YajC [Candidatus Brocadiia bacterium]
MLSLTIPILAQAAGTASAPSGPAGGAPSSPFSPMFFVWIIAIFAIIYFMMIRPQKKKEQQRKEMLNKLERGAEVVTIGGLFGEVQNVDAKEEYVILLVDRERGTTLKFRRGAIHEILTQGSGSAEDKKQ